MNDSTTPDGQAIRVSVCLAAYKGSRFIEEQIASILGDLGPDDELVVVDDASPDDTAEIVKGIRDPRIRLVGASVNKGYVRTFEQAVKMSRGEFIMLSDQDDVWIPGRVDIMLDALADHKIVAGNFDVLGGGPRPWIPRLRASDSGRHLANLFAILIGYRAYYGCAMGIRRDALSYFVPIPSYVNESHDLWLAICGNVARSIRHLDESTVLRRLHDDNQTPAGWRSLVKIIKARMMIARLMFEALRRVRLGS
ncbi:glycosyltransferase [Arthrobacter bambusae]|jgi:glycosyltransferase involved in cell wall biosynthesis|uniref:glycosyltransferase n=1 Tax=Arthrobacter bambusae TaxID=1338426 RepID=UPI00278235BA|nr:glycosyltransferase [Arthrobacter bambusae]MDQ0240011.1 glycosyltransferase involved in cell wall biosynthesis [Arthrobacter bambusae]